MPKRKPIARKKRSIGPIDFYERTEEGKKQRAERKAAGIKPRKKKRIPKGKTSGYPMSYLSNKKTKKKYLDKALGYTLE